MQIAKLTEKRPDNVKVVMEELRDQGLVSFAEIQENSTVGDLLSSTTSTSGTAM